MDNHWPSDVVEFGAINITGFRIVDTNRRALRDFHDSRKRLEPLTAGSGNGGGAGGLPAISVNVQKRTTPVAFYHSYSYTFTSLFLSLFLPPSLPNRHKPHSCTTRSLCSSRPSIAFSARSRISFVPIIYSDAATAAVAPVPRMPSTSPAPCWTVIHPRVG